MERFIKFYQKDKQVVKMINQSEKGFELVILSDPLFRELLMTINSCEEQNDKIYIVWQMKFKKLNFILYRNCVFSAPMDNFKDNKPCGRKFKVTCSGTNFYSDSFLFKNREIRKSKIKYKDVTLLNRMLKIGELNLRSDEYQVV